MAQANSAEEHKLVSSFEAVRQTLMQREFADRLNKPLAYWALPNDRRLPLAFLGRSVGELLQTPFDELTATRGIGQKKIGSLVKLLHRATSDSPPAVPYGLKELADEMEQETQFQGEESGTQEFDPAVVSEALWVQWSETVQRFHLGRERLGRLAQSLQSLPTVIWETPLDEYLGRTLADIRQLRTHGEKRVRVVLEVFYTVHEMLGNAHPGGPLSLHLVPKFVPAVEDFLERVRRGVLSPARDELSAHVTEPLLRQILIDSGETVHVLARDRLGIGVPPKSVREQSREMGVTRARVYQLLEDCAKVMHVRWPEGRPLFAALPELESPEARKLLSATRQLFFPEKNDHENAETALETATAAEVPPGDSES